LFVIGGGKRDRESLRHQQHEEVPCRSKPEPEQTMKPGGRPHISHPEKKRGAFRYFMWQEREGREKMRRHRSHPPPAVNAKEKIPMPKKRRPKGRGHKKQRANGQEPIGKSQYSAHKAVGKAAAAQEEKRIALGRSASGSLCSELTYCPRKRKAFRSMGKRKRGR